MTHLPDIINQNINKYAPAMDALAKGEEMNELVYTELISQPYQNCKFSTGMVDRHPVDTLYLQVERDGKVDVKLLLRPDEMAAIAYCANGALWSCLESKLREATK